MEMLRTHYPRAFQAIAAWILSAAGATFTVPILIFANVVPWAKGPDAFFLALIVAAGACSLSYLKNRTIPISTADASPTWHTVLDDPMPSSSRAVVRRSNCG